MSQAVLQGPTVVIMFTSVSFFSCYGFVLCLYSLSYLSLTIIFLVIYHECEKKKHFILKLPLNMKARFFVNDAPYISQQK